MPHGEDGSALVLALVFLSLFGLFTASLLTFAETSFRGTRGVRQQRSAVYAADGAVEGAINAIRGTAALGIDPAEGGSCPDFKTASDVNGEPVTVHCQGQTGSGTVGGGSGTALGILTLAGSDGTGLRCAGPPACENGYWQTSQQIVRVNGGVYSNSTIQVSRAPGAQLNACPPSFPPAGCSTAPGARGTVTARGACTSGKIVAFDLRCPDGPPDPAAADPDYAPGQTAFDASHERTPPTCAAAGSGKVVSFLPGRYRSANALTALTNGSSSCTKNLYWFQPGVYYFEFQDGEVWRITDPNVAVVGGVNNGWTPAPPPARPWQVSMGSPSSCRTELTGAASGVQFIFGGNSRLEITNGRMELCGLRAVAGSQPVGVYAPKSNLAGSTLVAPPASSCLLRTPYDPSAGDRCALIKTRGSKTTFIVKGTVYAPAVPVDLGMTNVATLIISKGIIARTLHVGVTPKAGYLDPIIAAAGIGPIADRVVDFIACAGETAPPAAGNACGPGGVPKLRATVTYTDGGGSTPGRVVTVNSWSVLR